MKTINLLFLGFLFFFTSCVSKILDNSNGAVFFMKFFLGDNAPPLVSLTSPSVIDDDFELNRKITIVFNENIVPFVEKPIQVTQAGLEIEGKWEVIENCILFTPSQDLKINSTYSVMVYGIEDRSGNQMAGIYQFQFKTGERRDTTPIRIKATYPETDSASIELNKTIAIEFQEIIDPSTVNRDNFILEEQGTGPISEFDLINLGNIVQIKPKNLFKPSTRYTVTIKASIKDTANLEMGSDYVFSFITITESDITPPIVDAHFPLPKNELRMQTKQGSKALEVEGQEIYPVFFLLLNFNEPLDLSSIELNRNLFVREKETGTMVPIAARAGLSSILIHPTSAQWENNKPYELVATRAIRDLAGFQLKEEFRLTFTTTSIDAPPPPPPEIASTEPSQGADNAGLNLRVKISFTKPIFRPSVNIDTIYIQDPFGNRVNGTYKFENNFTILFTPSELLKPRTIYTGFIKTSVRGMGNDRLNSEYSFSFTTESLTPPKDLFFGSNFYALNRNIATPPITPSYSGYMTACNVSPALPMGLFLLNNCTIYGTPLQLSPTTVYTITASNAGGSASTRISIAVTEVGVTPLYIGYSKTEYRLVKGSPMSSINPSVVGEIKSCSVTPSLPAGVFLSNTCVLNGTPSEFKVSTEYTITARSDSQTTTAPLKLSVGSTGTISGSIAVHASVPSATIWEGIGNLVVTVSLSQSPVSIVAVDYTTEDGTAQAGTDYTAVSGTLYFREGETNKTVTIPITNDTIYEGSENFKFKLLLTLGDNSILGDSEILVTINDMDITRDLIAYHPFDGDPNDRVTGTTANIFGAPQLVADRRGNPNGAYSFSGSPDYIQAGSNVGITGNSPRTLSVWIKHPASPSGSIQHQVNWGSIAGSSAYGLWSTTVILFYGHADDFSSGQGITTNWDHWVFVYNSSTVFNYKNGLFVNQQNKSLNTGDSPLYFARRMDNIYYFIGSLDEVRVYSRAMDADEVKALYEFEK